MTQEATSTLELRDYLRVLRRRKWTIIITIILCTGIAVATTLNQKPKYQAANQILLEKRLVDTLFVPDQSASSPDAAARNRANESLFMSSPRVQAKVEEKLGRAPDPVGFATDGTSDVITIIATGPKPKLVAETANAYAATYLQVRQDLTVQDLEDAAKQLQTRITDLETKIAAIDGDLAVNPPATAIVGKPAPPPDPRTSQRNQLDSQRA